MHQINCGLKNETLFFFVMWIQLQPWLDESSRQKPCSHIGRGTSDMGLGQGGSEAPEYFMFFFRAAKKAIISPANLKEFF